MSNKIIYFLLLSIVVMSCSKDDVTKLEEKSTFVSIASVQTNGGQFTVELLAADTLFEGFNKLYFDIKNADQSKVSSANIMLNPMMHMTMKSHSAPKENPASTPNNDGYYEGAVVFIMPSNPDEGWTLTIAIESEGVKDTAKLVIPVVRNLDEKKKINIISPIDETKYFVSILEPSSPIVGINNFEVTVHYKASMMSFPAAEDLTISIEPEMPSMDHGSPNNQDPLHSLMGHYNGKVNFTMTGWWRVNVTIKKGEDVISDDAYFDITF